MEGTPAALDGRRAVVVASTGDRFALRAVVTSALRCIVVLAAVPCALNAQNPRQAVDDAYQAYEFARQRHQVQFDSVYVIESRWETLIEEQDQARERGDRAARNRLRADIQELSDERDDARAELLRIEEEWYDAGRNLIAEVGIYEELLTEQLERTPLGSEDDLIEELNEMGSLRDEVESQIGLGKPPELPEMPNIQALPEDGPDDLARKAESLLGFADKLDRLLEDLDHEIDELTRAQTRRNVARRFNRDILGNRIVPVGQGGAASGQGGADTTLVDLSRQTYAQQIESLVQLRERFVEQRDLARRRAAALVGNP